MRNRLPVGIEDRDLPIDEYKNKIQDNKNSYGYVSVLYLTSIIITVLSVLSVFIFRG